MEENNTVGEYKRRYQSLDKKQRWSLLGLSLFTVLIVVLWGVQMKANIYKPLNTPPDGVVAVTSVNNNINTLDAYTKDTDQDGLSDYQETNNYNTSPYIPDSDSDGFTDGEEVARGTDPNCPSGKTCQTEIVISDPTSLPTIETNASSTSDDLAWEKVLTGQSNPAVLRQFLINNGFDKEALDSISDEDLLASYEATLNKE